MNSASKTLYYFGFYLLLTGLTLMAFPNVLLALAQIEETTEIWIRVLGSVVFVVGIYYVFMAPANDTLFLMLSVYGRIAIFLWFAVFILIGWAPTQLILFGLVDLAGAGWTYFTLRSKS